MPALWNIIVWYSTIEGRNLKLKFFDLSFRTAYAQAKELFPSAVAGTALAVVNLFSTFGGAFYQQIMGVAIGLFPTTGHGYSTSAYSAAFGVCLAGVVVATGLVVASKEKRWD